MDAESLANTISGLSRVYFKKVVLLYLTKAFRLTPINKDGTNDGGSDWQLFNDYGGSPTIAIQDTVQKKQWFEKAIRDAENAIKKFEVTRFFFVTNRIHSALKMHELENEIWTQFRIPAKCLCGRDIAEFFEAQKLENEFFDSIDSQMATGRAKPPDARERAIYSYAVLSKDRRDLQNSIYDDTVFIVLYDQGPLGREKLVEEVVNLLKSSILRNERIQNRIDSLLTRGEIQKDKKTNLLDLSQRSREELQIANRSYNAEFKSLVSSHIALMHDKGKVSWSENDSEMLAVYITRAFICKQIESAKDTGANLTARGLIDIQSDPIQDMRDYLKSKGVQVSAIQEIIDELLLQASDLPMIKKLARATLFVALEGVDPITSCKSIGAARWSDVNVMIDASVAMPYLCANLFQATQNRFSSSNYIILKTLKESRCKLRISFLYINECASHLLKALDYKSLDKYASDLKYSQNAYVAHYYQLKETGEDVPANLLEYLENFSTACRKPQSNKVAWARLVMRDMQQMLSEYSVTLEEIPKLLIEDTRDVQEEYLYYLREHNKSKPNKLIDHDVTVLAHIRRQVANLNEPWIFLTWDKTMIEVGAKLGNTGLVINPEPLSDFMQGGKPINEVCLCRLAHSLARAKDTSHIIAARIIDRFAFYAGEKLNDAHFRRDFKQFKDELIKEITFDEELNFPKIDEKIDEFLRKSGVPTSSFIEYFDA